VLFPHILADLDLRKITIIRQAHSRPPRTATSTDANKS
jgi:hypothetical protein